MESMLCARDPWVWVCTGRGRVCGVTFACLLLIYTFLAGQFCIANFSTLSSCSAERIVFPAKVDTDMTKRTAPDDYMDLANEVEEEGNSPKRQALGISR